MERKNNQNTQWNSSNNFNQLPTTYFYNANFNNQMNGAYQVNPTVDLTNQYQIQNNYNPYLYNNNSTAYNNTWYNYGDQRYEQYSQNHNYNYNNHVPNYSRNRNNFVSPPESSSSNSQNTANKSDSKYKFNNYKKEKKDESNTDGQRDNRESNSHGQRDHRESNSYGQRDNRESNSQGQRNHRESNTHGQRDNRESNSYGQRDNRESNSYGQRNHKESNTHGQRDHKSYNKSFDDYRNRKSNEAKAEMKEVKHDSFDKKKNSGQNNKLKTFDDENQREMLDEQLRKGQYECMVCCEEVKIRDPIWNCNYCYNIFHLKCIKTWSNSEAALYDNNASSTKHWRCPACQNPHDKVPNRYFCFCGKVRDPELNRYYVPHSCGEACQKLRRENASKKYQCNHKCNILCHPGPCPPCQVRVTRKCPCGKTNKIVKCAGNDEDVICLNICGKTLNCGRHTCERTCHFGDCSDCEETTIQLCYCGKEKREIKCTDENKGDKYSCKSKCDKLLSCSNHKCEEICHDGECKKCPHDPKYLTFCPCGKTKLTDLSKVKRTSCLDPIPTCDQICDKRLICRTNDDFHKCKSLCHTGPCPPCSEKSIIRCRCGANSKSLNCKELTQSNSTFICKKRCNKKKKCGRHKCLNECCVDNEHQCQQICGRKLSCGTHTCEELCHFTKCPSCWNVSWEELTCRCGESVLFPPIACGTKRPDCTQTCTRIHPCGHPITHYCHDDVTCPPCTYLISKMCYGQHEKRAAIPCYQEGVSCGNICNKPLSCGLHNCQKVCHPDDCGECTSPCSKIRSDCQHICGLPCHQKTNPACPKSKCKTMVKVTCPCGRLTDTMACYKVASVANRLPAAVLAKSRIVAGESIDVAHILRSIKENRYCRLKCDEMCSVVERNRLLAEALNIKDVDFSPNPGPPNYTENLKDAALNDPKFVSEIYEILSKLVLDSKQCKLSFKNYNFPPMNSNHRQIIHELAEFFGCKSHAIDKEPNRSVVVKAPVGKCYLPTVSLMDFVGKKDNTVLTNNNSKIKLVNCKLQDQEVKLKVKPTNDIKTPNEEKIDYFDFPGD